jgi:4-oxalocrotonate tautomerase
MPFVSIRIVKEVLAPDPAAKKAAIGGKVARAISEATGLPASEVSIVFEEVEARNWYVGEIDVETRRRAMKSG